MTNELDTTKKNQDALVTQTEANMIYGFEESKSDDIIIPRIKVINALSPERIDGIANEGDILNSLTQEKMKDKKFIPIRQYYSNIWWNDDRDADERIHCRSFDGRIGNNEDGTLVCAVCKKNQFDNTKEGKDAYPLCTAYLNFLGFFEGDAMPVVLSFSKTNYNEGKKMLSIAKSMRASMWNYGYLLEGKKVTKGKNTWYNIMPTLAGETDLENRTLAFELYKAYNDLAGFSTNYDDSVGSTSSVADTQTENEIG